MRKMFKVLKNHKIRGKIMKQLISYFIIALSLVACVEVTVNTKDSIFASRNTNNSENIEAESSREMIQTLSTGARSDKLVALVIGNKNYEYSRLANTLNDATDVANLLKEIGFQVILKKNLSQRDMDDALREFGEVLSDTQGVGLFYYAGHGARVDGQNYLVPVDNKKIQQEDDLKYYAVHAHKVLETMKKARDNFNIVILDACRNNPFKGERSMQRGLVGMSSVGSIIAFATDQGKTASDNLGERNGLYTKHLLKELKKAVREHTRVDDMFTNVRNAVLQDSDGKQQPWILDSLGGIFCFGGCPNEQSVQQNVMSTPKDKVNVSQVASPAQTQKSQSLNSQPVSNSPIIPNIVKKNLHQVIRPLPTREWKSIKAHKSGWEGAICVDDCLAFSPDGQFLLSGSYDKTLKLFNIESGKVIRTFTGHQHGLNSVAYSPDGQRILSGGSYPDNTMKLWNINTGAIIQSFEYPGWINSVDFSPDGQTALLGGGFLIKGEMNLWDLSTNQLARTFKGWFKGHSSNVESIAYSPDGKTILSGSRDTLMKLWDLSTGEPIRSFKHGEWITSVAYSPDGKKVLSGGIDNTIKLWNLSTGKLIHTFKGHSGRVNSVAFSPDGQTIASGSSDKTIRLWETSSDLIRVLKGHENYVYSVTFSPDGTLASGDRDGVIKLWR